MELYTGIITQSIMTSGLYFEEENDTNLSNFLLKSLDIVFSLYESLILILIFVIILYITFPLFHYLGEVGSREEVLSLFFE